MRILSFSVFENSFSDKEFQFSCQDRWWFGPSFSAHCPGSLARQVTSLFSADIAGVSRKERVGLSNGGAISSTSLAMERASPV
jgi:hypothetical protein